MTDTKNILLSLAGLCKKTAFLLQESVQKREGRSCAAQISDLNRKMLSELSDIERAYAQGLLNDHALRCAHALGECVTQAFSAALLLPEHLPHLPALEEETACNAMLAGFPEQLLTTLSEFDRFPFYSLHLCANKGRGVHALLINHYISNDGGKWMIPLAQALEAHRNLLEHTCGILMERDEK